MKKPIRWEYLTESLNGSHHGLSMDEKLAKLGAEGWELVTVTCAYHPEEGADYLGFFKRELS